MKKKLCLFLLLFFCILTFSGFNVHAENAKFFTISANPAENSNTGMNIVWHTEKGVSGTYLLYTKKSDTSWSDQARVYPTTTLNTAFAGKNAKYGTTSDDLKVPYEFNKNEVSLSGLEPGTEYMYKVTDGSVSSDVRYFKTGNQEFNFVWVSDFHAYYASATRLNAATSAVNKCIATANNQIDFILSTGDTVAHGGTYQWWKQVSEASWMKNYMFCTTLGNHDWMTNVGTNYSDGASYKFMDACCNNPRNGFAGQENICYYFYYGDALFICVNTETASANYLGMTTDQFVKAQQDWVESVLQNNTAQYIFLMQHYQAFATSGAYQSTGYTRWHTICDKYGIDIFFSGNSHVYMRSLPIYDGEISTDPSKGTVYMVAPSSDGERGVAYSAPTKNTDKIVSSWSDTKAKAASVVKVTKDGISMQLVNYDGTILDSSTLLPKRLPTNLEPIDLSDFDKTSFESSFEVRINQNQITAPSLAFSSDASSVLRSIKVYNKDTNETYYEGMLAKNSTSCVLNNVDKGELSIGVELRYVDATTEELTFNINNRYEWGTIRNPQITQTDEGYILKWDESINASRISSIDVYIDGVRYDVIDAGTKQASLYKGDGRHNVQIIVKDKDGDVVYTSQMLNYEINAYYTVTFLDSNGKELKKETVASGASATPPEYKAPKGYEFDGWDKDISSVKSDLFVKPVLREVSSSTEEGTRNFSCNMGTIWISSFVLLFSLGIFLKKRKY